MSVETTDSPVSVERFARVFVKGPEELPSHADTYYQPERGYYFKLHLDRVSATEATPMIEKASERFEVELVRRVTKDGFFKERVYVDQPSDVPDGYKVHTGPDGGVYYETGVQQVASPDAGSARNVAVIHWDDVELGDEIVYETPEGEEKFAEIIDIDEQGDEADVVHVDVDGEAHRAMPGTYSVDNGEQKSLTSTIRLSKEGEWVNYSGPRGGDGWRNIRTGEVVYQENPPGEPAEGSDDEPMGADPDFDPADPPDGGYAPGWEGPPEGPTDLWPGQSVEVYLDGAYHYGEVEAVGDGEVRIDPDEADDSISVGFNEVTAREDVDNSAVETQPDPWSDVQRFEEDEVAQEFIDTVNNEPGEGFTFKRNLEVDNPFERDVWFVGITSENLEAGEMDKEEILDFYHDWLDVLEEEPALHIGGYAFEDGEKVSIDLSVAVEDAEEAEALGEQFNQESIANLFVAEEQGWDEGLIFTGGEGESPVEGPDDVREALSDIDSLAKRLWLGKSKVFDHEKVYDAEGRRLSGSQIAYMALHGELDPRAVDMVPVEEKSEGGGSGTLTSGTSGARNAVHSVDLPDVCRLCDNDRKEGSMLCEECADTEKDCDGHHVGPYMEAPSVRLEDGEVYCEETGEVYEDVEIDGVMGKCPFCEEMVNLGELYAEKSDDLFGADVFRVMPDPSDADDFDGDLIGIGIDFPNDAVYVDWRNEAFPSELDHSHVSIYGSIDDLEQATGNVTEHMETIESETSGLMDKALGSYRRLPGNRPRVYDLSKETAEGGGQWVSFVGPEGGEGWVNLMTGEKRYQKQRPGPTPEGHEEPEFADGWEPAPESFNDLEVGQMIEFENHLGEFEMGEYIGLNEQGNHAVSPEGSDSEKVVGPDFNNTLTAAEAEFSRHDPFFDDPDKDTTSEEYWGAVQDEIPPEADSAFEPFEVGQDVALDLPGQDDPVSVPIYGFVDGDSDDFPASSDSLVFHYDDLEAAVGPETMADRWGEPGETNPTLTGPPGSVGDVILGPAEEHIDADPEPEPSDGEDEEGHSWDEVDLGEDEWLAEQGANIDTQFYHEVGDEAYPATVTGATSMTTDDTLSHAVLEVDVPHKDEPHTTPVHPNIVPDTIPEGPLEGQVQTASDDTPTDEFDSVDAEIGDVPEGSEVIVTDGNYYTTAEVYPNSIGYDPGDGDTLYPEDVEIAAIHEDDAEALAEPEESEEAETSPSEEEVGEAVAQPASEATEDEGYPLDQYTPEDAEEFRDMSDIGANHGNSVSAMEVAVMPDGSKMVHKDLSHHTVTEDDIRRELAGYHAGKHFDENIPVHAANMTEGWAASEVAPGVDAVDATPEMKDAVSFDDFVDMAATQIMIGNTDLHQNNVRVDEEGNLYAFDLDRAAGDVTGDWVGNLDHYDDTLDRMLGELEKSAKALDVEVGTPLKAEILHRAEEKASDVDGAEMDAIYDDVAAVDEDFAETIRMNISRIANGEISL